MTEKPKTRATPRRSPSGYWDVVVSADMPEIFGERFRAGGAYRVSDAALDALDAAGAVASAEPFKVPEA